MVRGVGVGGGGALMGEGGRVGCEEQCWRGVGVRMGGLRAALGKVVCLALTKGGRKEKKVTRKLKKH